MTIASSASMQGIMPRDNQTSRPGCIARASPVKHPPEPLMLGEVRLELDGARIVIRDEASVAADAEGRGGVLVDLLLCAGTREIAVLKGSLFAGVSRVGLSWFLGA